jgi:tetratricopeptide (TPR) repeat protein
MKSAKNKWKNILFEVLIFILLISCQTDRKIKRLSDESIMYGMIYDNESTPVSGVAVLINGKKIADSDIQGRFILNDVKRGIYTIKLSKKGYEDLEEQFNYEPLNVLYFKIFNSSQLAALAENAMDDKNYFAAGQFLDRALKIEPMRHDVLFLKSINEYLQKKYDDALAILEELIKSGVADESVARLWELIKGQKYSGEI